MKSQLVTTQAAAEKLGLSPSQFSRICRARGYEPDLTEEWHYGRRSGERHPWAARTLAALARTTDAKEARARRAKLDAAVAAQRGRVRAQGTTRRTLQGPASGQDRRRVRNAPSSSSFRLRRTVSRLIDRLTRARRTPSRRV